MNYAVLFKLPQLPGQDAFGHIRNGPPQFAESRNTVGCKLVEDDGLPLPANQLQGEFEKKPVLLIA